MGVASKTVFGIFLALGIQGASLAQQAGSAGPSPEPKGRPAGHVLPEQANPNATRIMAPARGIDPGPPADATTYAPVAARARPRGFDVPEAPLLPATPSP